MGVANRVHGVLGGATAAAAAAVQRAFSILFDTKSLLVQDGDCGDSYGGSDSPDPYHDSVHCCCYGDRGGNSFVAVHRRSAVISLCVGVRE